MRCSKCGGPLGWLEGESFCASCTRFGLTADSADQGVDYDLDGDQATALRDAGRGTDEDYGCPGGDKG